MNAPSLERGDSSRSFTALFAAGGFMMLAGVVFLAPFLFNTRAQENDVFLTNLFVGPLFYLIGGIIVILRLPALGLAWRLAIGLLFANLAVVAVALWLARGAGVNGINALAVTLFGDTLMLFATSLFVAGAHNRSRAWGRALLLAIGGTAIVSLAYLFLGGRYLAFGETQSALPPYLDLPIIGLSLALGAGVFLLGRAWSRR